MKIKDIQGREVKFDVIESDYPMSTSEEFCKSKIQFRCGQVLRRTFPRHIILEEFTIPGSALKIDFFIPQLQLALEVQGAQHEKFIPFFHGDKQTFVQSKFRDSRKADWCEANNIRLIYAKKEEDVRTELERET